MVLTVDEIAQKYYYYYGKYADHLAGLAPPSLESGTWREFYRKNAVKFGNLYKKRTGRVPDGFNEVRLR